MARRLFNRGILSVENDDLTPVAPGGEEAAQDVAVAEAGQELAEAVVEQTESEVEGEAREAELAEGGEIAEALESLAVLAADSAKGQGFSRDAAAAVGMQFDYYRRRLGDTGPSKMPSLESFGATSSRIRGTTASMEEIGDLAKRAWKAIVEKVKAAFKWIRDHFLKVFGSAERLVKRADALKAKAENTKGTIQEKSFENESLTKKLYIGTANLAAEAAVGEVKKASSIVTGTLTHAFSVAPKLIDAVEAGLKSETAGTNFSSDGITAPQGFAPGNEIETGFKAEGTVTTGSEELPGGKIFAATVPGGNQTGTDALEAMAYTKLVVAAKKGTKAPTNFKFETLEAQQAAKIADEVSKMATFLVQSRKSVDEIGKKRDSLERALDGFAREFEKADGEGADDKKKASAAAKKLVGKIPTIVDFGVASVTAYALNMGSAYLDYAQLSLKQYAEK